MFVDEEVEAADEDAMVAENKGKMQNTKRPRDRDARTIEGGSRGRVLAGFETGNYAMARGWAAGGGLTPLPRVGQGKEGKKREKKSQRGTSLRDKEKFK